ncbi:MAG: PorV/PorQ family protein [bacterium]
MKKYISIILGIIFISSIINAQNLSKSGTTAGQFLKIGVGPRALGMGGAFVATADDISAMYWNPAGLTNNTSNEAFFDHTSWFADINHDFAGVSSYIDGIGTVGAFVSVLSIDEMLVRTIESPEGTGEYFESGGISIGISFARNLTDAFSIGINAKYIREYIWHESASGIAFDIGTLYKIPVLNEFRIGASITNFGSKMKMDGRDILSYKQVGSGSSNLISTKVDLDEYDLPLVFRVGAACDIYQTVDNRITLALDAVHPNDHSEYVNTGAEYCWNEIVSLRAGYTSLFETDTEKGLSLGIGLKYNLMNSVKIKVDYAYQDYNRLTEVHYFSFGIVF